MLQGDRQVVQSVIREAGLHVVEIPGDRELALKALSKAGWAGIKCLRPKREALKPVLDSIAQTERSLEQCCQDILTEEKKDNTNVNNSLLNSLYDEKLRHQQILRTKVRNFQAAFAI